MHRLSHDHRQILAFTLRLKKGVAKQADLAIMHQYIQYFWKEILEPHIRTEEKNLYALIRNQNPLIQRALQEHIAIKKLVEIPEISFTYEHCEALSVLVHDHVRFEERMLFNELQNQLSESQLNAIQLALLEKAEFCDNWVDVFWE